MWQKQVIDPKTGNLKAPGTPGAKETNKWFIPTGFKKDIKGKNQTTYATVSSDEKDDLMNRYTSIQNRMNRLPSQINNPQTGVSALPVTAGTAPPPSTVKRDIYHDAQGNRAYKNPDGTWEPIQ
jgi:hypothetical protein